MEKATVASKKTKSSNKHLLIALGVAIALLVVVVAGIYIFFQSPERQVANGFANLVKADKIGISGTINATGSNGTYHTTLTAKTNKQVTSGEADFKYTGASNKATLAGKTQVIIAEDGTLYAKLNEPKKFMNALADSFVAPMVANISAAALTPEQQALGLAPLRASFAQAGEKMEGKWVKVNQSELRILLGGGSETSSDCYAQFASELERNSGARGELASAYLKYQFISIVDSLESEGTSRGYRVSIDQAKLKEFNDKVADNAAVKKLGSCGHDILTLGAADNLNNQSIDIWIDRLSSKITHVRYDKTTSDGSTAVDLKFDYGVSVDTTVPQQSVNLSTVLPELLSAQ